MRSPRTVVALGALGLCLAAPTTALAVSDLGITIGDSPDPVAAGASITYTLTATNSGPDAAASVTVADTLAAGTTFQSLSQPLGWICTTPAVGTGGTVTCTTASMSVATATFTLVVAVDPAVADGTVLSNTATIATTDPDPDPTGDAATATTTVRNAADLAVAIADAPDPADVGEDVVYTVGVDQLGPLDAQATTLTVDLPADATFQALTAPAGWTCSVPAVLSMGQTATCTTATLAPGSRQFTAVVRPTAAAAGATITVTATADSATPDPTPADRTATATTSVRPLPTPPEPPRPPSGGPRRPTVLAVTPVSGGAGAEVVVTGDGFATTTQVLFGDRPARAFVVDGHGRITARAPRGVPGSTVDVVVVNAVGSSPASSLARFAYDPLAPPPIAEPPRLVTCAAVPDLRGRTIRRARRTLARAGCAAATIGREPGTRGGKRRRIAAQTPAAGAVLREGERIVVRLRARRS